MSILPQILVNGLIAGCTYSLIASGFSLSYLTSRFFNFAYGSIISLAAYVLFYLCNILSIDFVTSLVLTLIVIGFSGFATNNYLYRPLRRRGSSGPVLLVASFSLSIAMTSFIQIFFGADMRLIKYFSLQKSLSFMGITVTHVQIAIFIITFVLLLVLYFLMKKTILGKMIRAVADNKDCASILGISSEKVINYSFVISSILVGLAGIFMGIDRSLDPSMGANLMIKGFTGAIIGGIDSVPGAILGSFFLGIVENFGILIFPPGYKDVITFFFLFLFLLIRPHGIWGIKKDDIND